MKKKERPAGGKEKTVVPCNFRLAGRISNEMARALTSIHENLARNLTTALGGLVGAELEVKLSALDQLHFQEHVATISAYSCIIPFSAQPSLGTVLVESDIEMMLPFIDLLLGGDGSQAGAPRELSEIEEEIIQDVFLLIVRQAEVCWGLPSGALTAGQRVRPPMLDQVCPHTEKVACIKFALGMGAQTGSFQLLLSSSFLNMLLQQAKPSQPRTKTALRHFPRQGIRDRIMDSEVEVAVELPSLKIAVKDLLALLPVAL